MTTEWLSKNNTNAVRAVAAIGIIYTHLLYFTTNPNLLILKDIGYLCVGIFFFYTGYNAIYSYVNHGLKGFVLKKLKRVYLPYVIANICMIVVNTFNGEGAPNILPFKTVLLKVFGIQLANPTLWYVTSVILFYILFFIVFEILSLVKRISKTSYLASAKITVLLCFMIVFVAYSILLPRVAAINGFTPNGKSQYPLPLIAGAIFALFTEPISTFIKKYKFQTLVLLFLILLPFHFRNMAFQSLKIWRFNLYDAMPPVLAALIANVYLHNEHINSKVLQFIGDISYELYLLHYVFLTFLRSTIISIANDYLYVAVYTVVLVIAAFLLHDFCKLTFLPARCKADASSSQDKS